ncbi:UPAR/Ly6 domain-containing protein crok-like [Panulirus ornatus]|uniref:UPAR/Ly6 domain-containing protein crok-like n=1 Tax=Panulirus ornatus TaxID=150431 RepID=UPI003A887003
MYPARSLLPLSLLLLHMLTTAQGIKCWFCNSMLDPFCSDPFDNSTATPKDCSLEGDMPHLRGVPATMCRKTRMKVNGHWRYKRDCARLGEAGVGGDARYCIYRTGTFNIHVEYCTCNDKDGCNPASYAQPSFHLVASASAGIMMVMGRWLLW